MHRYPPPSGSPSVELTLEQYLFPETLKSVYFIINKWGRLFLKLLSGRPKLLAAAKLMTIFFLRQEFYQFKIIIQKSFYARAEKDKRLQCFPNSAPGSPLRSTEIHLGPRAVQAKQLSLFCFFKKIKWMKIMDFIQLPLLKVEKTEAQRHAMAFYKVAQLGDLDK